MKYSFAAAAVLAVAGLASAQIPSCAQPCLQSAITSATKCGSSDLVCQCQPSNQQAIQGAATQCVLNACGDKALSVLSAAQAECAAALASASSSAAAPATTAADKTTAAVTSTSAAPATTSAEKTTLTTTAAATTTTHAPTGASNSTGNGTITSGLPPTPSGNGAPQMAASLGGAFVMAAVALLAF